MGNVLIHDTSWDHTQLLDALLEQLHISPPLSQYTQLKQAKPLIINIPTNDLGKVDVYIDNFIAVTPDIENNCAHIKPPSH